MARNYKQRFKVNANASGGDDDTSPDDGGATDGGNKKKGGKKESEKVSRAEAFQELADKLDSIYERFQKGMIDAADASSQAASAIGQMGEAAGFNAKERELSVENFERKFGTDTESKLNKAFDEALDKFTKGLIDADEAVRRQQAALDKYGEKLGMTLDEREQYRKDGFDEVRDAAAAGGKQGPLDPKNPLNNLISSVGGKFGIPAEMTKSAAGSLGGAGGPLGGVFEFAGKNAGPIAAVAAGAKAMEAFYGGVTDVTRKLTSVGQSIAKNDGVGAITGLMDGIGSAAKKIPVVGGLLEKQIGMYSQFIKSFDVITEAFKARGEELSKFSGPIAAASANAKVEKLLADINEGQRLGNEYAAIIREKTEAQVEFQKALEPIKMALMQQLVPILKVTTNVLKGYNSFTDEVGRDVKNVVEAIKVLITVTNPGMAAMVDGITRMAENQKKAADEEKQRKQQEFIAQLFDVSREVSAPPQGQTDNSPNPLAINMFS